MENYFAPIRSVEAEMARFDGPTPVRRRKVTPWVVCGLVAFFAAAPIACGGGEETSEEATTKAEWVARADRICVKAGKTIGPQTASTFRKHPPETDALISWLQNVGPLQRQAIGEIEAIPVPAGDEQQVAAIVEASTETTDRLEQGIADPAVRQALLKEGFFPKEFKAFRAYGTEKCARAVNPFAFRQARAGAGGTPVGGSAE